MVERVDNRRAFSEGASSLELGRARGETGLDGLPVDDGPDGVEVGLLDVLVVLL